MIQTTITTTNASKAKKVKSKLKVIQNKHSDFSSTL